jgi:hypothetical protein
VNSAALQGGFSFALILGNYRRAVAMLDPLCFDADIACKTESSSPGFHWEMSHCAVISFSSLFRVSAVFFMNWYGCGWAWRSSV